MSLLSSIKKSRELCLRCVDKNQHHCSRVTHQMLEDNKVYRMELCGDIKDGTWTESIERCVGVQKIGSSNFTCGHSRAVEKRICTRSLGGKKCRDKTGAVVENDVMVASVPCQDVDCPVCPGKTVHNT